MNLSIHPKDLQQPFTLRQWWSEMQPRVNRDYVLTCACWAFVGWALCAVVYWGAR